MHRYRHVRKLHLDVLVEEYNCEAVNVLITYFYLSSFTYE